MKISIFGTGYVGLVTGVCLADLGHQVICVDINQQKIDQLKNGHIPIYEPGLAELVIKNKTNLTFTTDAKLAVQASSVIFIAVGTPQSPDGAADLTFINQVAETIAANINNYKVIVIKSTVPVGTGDQIEKLISQIYDGEFAILSNPEFLKEGSAIADFMIPDRIVIGGNSPKAIQILKTVYQKFKSVPFVITDRQSSELIKYASNAFLATKISFMNSMANLSEKVGADIKSIAEGMGLDPRIGRAFLNAGLGYGGSCFPKDVQALIYTSKRNHSRSPILEAVDKVNQNQKLQAIAKLEKKMDLKNKTIAILGLSFKPNTDDLREAPSLTIISELIKKGVHIKAWDEISEPECQKLFPQVHYCPSPYEALQNADAAIIVTEWDKLKNLDLKKAKQAMKTPLIIDGRNILDKEQAKSLGIDYMGIGR